MDPLFIDLGIYIAAVDKCMGHLFKQEKIHSLFDAISEIDLWGYLIEIVNNSVS